MLDDNDHQENDDWPLLSAIHGATKELPDQISRSLHNLIETSRQTGECGDGVPWPCFDYEAASKFLFFQSASPQSSNQKQREYFMTPAQAGFSEAWDTSKLWAWALTPELLITWVCLAILLSIMGCCWICKQLSDGLCKIVVILCLTVVLVSMVLAFSVSAAPV